MGEDVPPGKARAGAVQRSDLREVLPRRGAHAHARRRVGRRPHAGFGAPAREGIDVAKAERQIDRPAELGGIEARGDAACCDLGKAALQEPGAMPLPARGAGHQHHADPGDGRPQRQHQRACDPLPRGLADAEPAALAQHEAPVGRNLVPARLHRQRRSTLGVAGLERLDLQPGFGRHVRTGHRAPRSGWACRGSRRRERASPRSTRSCARAAPAGARAQPPCAGHC